MLTSQLQIVILEVEILLISKRLLQSFSNLLLDRQCIHLVFQYIQLAVLKICLWCIFFCRRKCRCRIALARQASEFLNLAFFEIYWSNRLLQSFLMFSWQRFHFTSSLSLFAISWLAPRALSFSHDIARPSSASGNFQFWHRNQNHLAGADYFPAGWVRVQLWSFRDRAELARI